MSHQTVLVRRSLDDLVYQRSDIADRCEPGDNIHPTFFSQPIGFSSFGCQTVVGSCRNGTHSGSWAAFRTAAGFTTANGVPGKAFMYMLLTGAEARMASALRTGGLATDKIALRRLRRLRFGSHGAAVKALQQQLNLPNPNGDFGPNTCAELHKLQTNLPGSTGSDGILTPELHDGQGWQFLASIGV
jgi:endonuclease G